MTAFFFTGTLRINQPINQPISVQNNDTVHNQLPGSALRILIGRNCYQDVFPCNVIHWPDGAVVVKRILLRKIDLNEITREAIHADIYGPEHEKMSLQTKP